MLTVILSGFTTSAFSQSYIKYYSIMENYIKKEMYDSALVYAEKTLASFNEEEPENETKLAEILRSFSEIYYYKEDYKKAIVYSTKEMEMLAILLGQEDPEYAYSCYFLGIIYFSAEEYDSAEVYIRKSKDLYKDIYYGAGYYYAISLADLGRLYFYGRRNYPEAEIYFKNAIGVFKSSVGEKNVEYAYCLSQLAFLYNEMDRYKDALPLFLESVRIIKETEGKKNLDYSYIIEGLAELYNVAGNYKEAELLYKEAVKIHLDIQGENNTEYANCLESLGDVYSSTGNYSEAEPLLKKALKIIETQKGKKNWEYINSLNNVAGLYSLMGNFPLAITFSYEALEISKEVYGIQDVIYSESAQTLADIYYEMDDFKSAEPLYIESEDICREIYGEFSYYYAQAIHKLGNLYWTSCHLANDTVERKERLEKADYLIGKSLGIYKSLLGEKHPDFATALISKAGILYKLGKYQESEPYILKGRDIYKEILGNKNPNYAISIYNLARLYEATRQFELAKPLILEGLMLFNESISKNFECLSEKEKELFFKTKSWAYEYFYSYSLRRKNEDPTITKSVYDNIVRNKGLLLKSSTHMRMAIHNSKDKKLIELYDNWISLKEEISNLNSTEISQRTKNPEELEILANNIEKELMQKSQIFSDFKKLQNISWEGIKNSLKPNEAAVEFISFPYGNKKDSVVYCALIVTPQSIQPEMIMLFEESQIDSIINPEGKNNLSFVNGLYGLKESANESLYQIIWKPIEPFLKNYKTVYYSPDGILHKVSFSAMGTGKNVFLCDNYNLHRVGSTGIVAISEEPMIKKNISACVIGGVDYNADQKTEELWNYLPGTLKETNSIKAKFTGNKIKVKSYTGKDATEMVFKYQYSEADDRPYILHIATHGFFFPDPDEEVLNNYSEKKYDNGIIAFRGGSSGFGLWQFVRNENPLMRSGLVLAGANKVWSEPMSGTDNDGVLTSQEVTQLDMSGTKLVVLSACETGLGDIRGSEGVYGLQRAFKMAGVRFIIMSLWQVPDNETVEFMETYYSKLLILKDIRAAFNETQKEMRKKYDPYFWGAFVLIE